MNFSINKRYIKIDLNYFDLQLKSENFAAKRIMVCGSKIEKKVSFLGKIIISRIIMMLNVFKLKFFLII